MGMHMYIAPLEIVQTCTYLRFGNSLFSPLRACFEGRVSLLGRCGRFALKYVPHTVNMLATSCRL